MSCNQNCIVFIKYKRTGVSVQGLLSEALFQQTTRAQMSGWSGRRKFLEIENMALRYDWESAQHKGSGQ